MIIAIDIPKGTYEAIKVGTINQVLEIKVWRAIQNGKILEELDNPCIDCGINCCQTDGCECQKVFMELKGETE